MLYEQKFFNVLSDFEGEGLLGHYRELVSVIENGGMPAISAIFADEVVAELRGLARKIQGFKQVVVLGVGGSSLGGKTLTSIFDQDKLRFLESIDPKTVAGELAGIDLGEAFFLVISKSGETIETICQLLVILDEIVEVRAQNFLFVTQSDDNPLAQIAKKVGAEIFYHPRDVGGRFSCFSVTGILPALICGVDVEGLFAGAKEVLAEFLQGEENRVFRACAVQDGLYRQGVRSNVMMPYIDVLKNFTDWYRQLWAESLGKGGFGLTPINSMGTVDQHSQLQLYLEGPRDKFYSFFTLKNHGVDFEITDFGGVATLFGGKKLSDIVKVEQDTTIETLNLKKLPIRVFEIEHLDEKVLGGLMMQMFLEVILLARCNGIDPFDQPAVELRKNMAREILARN